MAISDPGQMPSSGSFTGGGHHHGTLTPSPLPGHGTPPPCTASCNHQINRGGGHVIMHDHLQSAPSPSPVLLPVHVSPIPQVTPAVTTTTSSSTSNGTSYSYSSRTSTTTSTTGEGPAAKVLTASLKGNYKN